MKTYQQSMEEKIANYQQLKSRYDKITQDDEFYKNISSMPYEFIRSDYIIGILSTFHESGGSMAMRFENAEDAISLFKKVIGFKKDITRILEGASYIQQVSSLITSINRFVNETPYLPSSFSVPPLSRKLEMAANQALKTVPNYSSFKTKAFLIGFIENCVEYLSREELSKVLASGIIKGNDLDRIRLTGSAKYEENIAYLKEITGHKDTKLAQYKTRLKGVSKPDEDGLSRQIYLKRMSEQIKAGQTPVLKAESCTYTPETGVSEPAIKVFWQNRNTWQNIGFIPKEIVKEISDKYNITALSLKPVFKSLIGGNNVSYGCDIELDVSAVSLDYKLPDKKIPADMKIIER